MAAHSGEPKKRSSHVDGMPRDGMTGMGFYTQRHFIEVKEKMNGYLAEQGGYEYDQEQRPKERHPRHPLNPALLDGKRATKPVFLPSADHRHEKTLSNHKTHSPKPDHRHTKPSSRPGEKK